MTGLPIVMRFAAAPKPFPSLGRRGLPLNRPDLHTLWGQMSRLPASILDAPLVRRYLDLLGPLHWDQLPERNLQRNWGQTTIPYAAFAAACLVKLEENRPAMGDLRSFLVDHPQLIWLLGFPLASDRRQPDGFDAAASLPTARHFTRLLRTLPNSVLQRASSKRGQRSHTRVPGMFAAANNHPGRVPDCEGIETRSAKVR